MFGVRTSGFCRMLAASLAQFVGSESPVPVRELSLAPGSQERRTWPGLFRRSSEAGGGDLSVRRAVGQSSSSSASEGGSLACALRTAPRGLPRFVSPLRSRAARRRVGPDPRWPYQWGTAAAPCPRGPAHPCSLRVRSLVRRPSTSPPFPPAFCFFAALLPFPGSLPPRGTPGRGSFSAVISARSEVSGVICPGTHEFLFT